MLPYCGNTCWTENKKRQLLVVCVVKGNITRRDDIQDSKRELVGTNAKCKQKDRNANKQKTHTHACRTQVVHRGSVVRIRTNHTSNASIKGKRATYNKKQKMSIPSKSEKKTVDFIMNNQNLGGADFRLRFPLRRLYSVAPTEFYEHFPCPQCLHLSPPPLLPSSHPIG